MHREQYCRPIERSLLDRIETLTRPSADAPVRTDSAGPRVDSATIANLLEAQITSRIIDYTARCLRAEHQLGHYTIGSAGHEANAMVALALRPTDPALLHYRSGAFYVARSLQAEQSGKAVSDPIDDVLRGMLARSTEPIAGGRHKVFGSHALSILPQTSTISSHLPRAVGLALSFELGRTDGQLVDHHWPEDSVVICSFGDGSLNHSTAQGALNWASQLSHAGQRVPILFVCEDNGLGLSVPTTPGWVAASLKARPALGYTRIEDSDPEQGLPVLANAVAGVRDSGIPGVVHLRTVRYLGHAGTDVEAAYRPPGDIRTDLELDPILATARTAWTHDVCTPTELVEWYQDLRSVVRARALELAHEPQLANAEEVMEPLTPSRSIVFASTTTKDPLDDPEKQTLAQAINATLAETLATRSETLVFGEDVGRKGGAYGVTRGLQKRFGVQRVFDTILDEQSVLGLSLGSAVNGFLPIPEIQYLAYLHNAEDQIRGEAATLAFFSNRQYLNPVVIRVASYAYQKGFGGHFHNDNSIAVLRDIPGLVIASPAHADDAAPMLQTCVEHASATGAVCVFLEPIALYHTADLHVSGDAGWLSSGENGGNPATGGRVHGDGTDLTIITWGNGLYLSKRAAKVIAEHDAASVRILDLRWLAPLPIEQMLAEANASGRVLIVDETRRTGGVGEGLVTELLDAGFTGWVTRVAAHDSFIPLGAAANHVLVSEDDIITAARRILS